MVQGPVRLHIRLHITIRQGSTRSSADKPLFGTRRSRPNFCDRIALEEGGRHTHRPHPGFRPPSWSASIVSAVRLAAVQRAGGRSRRDWAEWATFAAFVGPNLLLLAIFSFWPLIQNLSLSFADWDMISPDKRFVGLENWISVLGGSRFWQIALNTATFTVGS